MKKHIQILINTLFISVFLFSFLSCNDTQGKEKNTDEFMIESDSVSKAINEKIAENNFMDTVVKDEEKNEEDIKETVSNDDYKLKGKPDTIVIEFDANNKLLIPGMLPNEHEEENPTTAMFVSSSLLQKHDSIFFTLNDIYAIDGNIEGNELFFETDKNFKLININCNAFAGIFFSEDGTWQEFGNYEYGKEPLKQVDEKIYEVPTFEGIAEVVPNKIIEKADKKTNENDLLSYDIYISKVLIEIQYSINGKKFKKTLVFDYEYGD